MKTVDGKPKDVGEVKQGFQTYYSNLFDSGVEDSDLPLDPYIWTAPESVLTETEGSWRHLVSKTP
eukprot:8651439-Alexandrium_andersonii.AAC.1